MSGTEFELVVTPGHNKDWAHRHTQGEVPGLWPYSLEHLQPLIPGLRLVETGPPSRRRRAIGRLLPGPRARSRVGLAWDENTAHRMVCARRYGTMHSGVIWATDMWEQGSRIPPGMRRTLARMDSVWTLSRGQLDRLDSILPASTPRHYVRFGIDAAFYSYAPYPERPLILSSGGDRDRDHDTVMRAFSIVATARPEVEAVVQTQAGVGGQPGVRVIPRLTHRELRALYARASVVAVATRPNLHVSGMTVCLEGQATGRPVVLTDTPGADDYVAEGETGYLTKVGDAEEMAERILHILDAPDAAAQMGKRARAAVEDRHTSADLARQLHTLVMAHSR